MEILRSLCVYIALFALLHHSEGGTAELRAMQKAMQMSGGYEGDIIKHPERNVMVNSGAYWDGGILPYEISDKFQPNERQVILRAINYLNDNTCVKPKLRSNTDAYGIYYTPESGPGCRSSVGFQYKEQQKIYLPPGEGCLHFGIALHETLHALGFWHQHNAANRDDYITIVWENVMPEQNSSLSKNEHGNDTLTSFGFEYDYDSIMHYHDVAYSKNGMKTIIPKKPEGANIGLHEELSEIDIKKLAKMYKC